MQIEYHLIDNNFTAKAKRDIKYIVIHYTAGVTSKPRSSVGTASWFNNPSAKASAHYIVDDGLVVQAVADNNIAWHCGTSGEYKHAFCRNSNSIGIEICSNHDNFLGYDKTSSTDSGWYFTKEAVKNAAELTADLMKKYNIPLENVIRHYDCTGKDCPAIWVDENKEGIKGWYNFLDMVKNYVNPSTINYKTINDIPEWAQESVKYFVCKGYVNGTGNGELNLNYDTVRFIVIMYRILKDKGVL